jgi:hypothetical protein
LDQWTFEFTAKISLAGKKRKSVKTSALSDAQKGFILKQSADGVQAGEICLRARISLTEVL